MREDDLQSAVLDMCKIYGLHVHHCRPAKMQSGRWVTPIQGNKGFPDLVIVGDQGILYAELKSAKGKVTTEQRTWLDRLEHNGAQAVIWRPDDLRSGRIQRYLEGLRGPHQRIPRATVGQPRRR